MGNINLLTIYLNPKKYDASGGYRDIHYLIRIDSDFLDEEQFSFSKNVTKIVRNGSPIAEDLAGGFIPVNIQYPLVVTRNGDEVEYYFKRIRNGITTYVSLEDALLPNTNENHFLPYDDLTFIPITLQHLHYYHPEEQKIYSVEIAMPEIRVFGHKAMDYNPKDLGGLTNGEYELDYKNAFGYTNAVSDQILGILEQGSQANWLRKININLYGEAGRVYWYPKIVVEQGKITLYYEYHRILNEDFEIPFKNGRFQHAIKLTFNHIEGFLAFMELTYFRNGVSPLDLWEGSGFRKRDCFKKYVEIVTRELENRVNNFNSKFSITGILSIIYYIPLDFFIKEQNLFRGRKNSNTVLGEQFIWFAIDSVIKIPITNFMVNAEDITLKLFEILEFIQQYKNTDNKQKNDYLLDQLLSKTYEGKSYLLAFYHKMNTNNFVRYNHFIYKIWRKSSYFNRDHEVYKNTSYHTKLTDIKKKEKKEPWKMLPYTADKTIGFYTSNIDAEFDENDNIVFTPDAHWVSDIFTLFCGEEARGVRAYIEGDWQITYHPLYPVSLPNPSDKDAIRLQKISPALLIKASEDKGFWNNVGTAASYTFDILTSLSGFGNLAKFRHLARISDAASIIKNGIRLKNTFYVYKAAKAATAAIEISSGTINILLRITGLEDTEFGRALTNFLFWLEMLTLSVDLTDAISSGLKLNAQIISKESKVLVKKLDELVVAKQIDEADKARVIKEVDDIALKQTKGTNINIELPPIKTVKVLPKSQDDVFKIVKKNEKQILILEEQSRLRKIKEDTTGKIDQVEGYEYAYIWNGSKGLRNLTPFTSNSSDYILFSDAFGKNVKITKKHYSSLKNATITHNHPNFSRFSNDDIKQFLKLQLKELRAINSKGIVYSLKRKAKSKMSNKEIKKMYQDLEVVKTEQFLDKLLEAQTYKAKQKLYMEIYDFEEKFLLDKIKDRIDYIIYK